MHSLKMVRLLVIRGFRGILITTSLLFTFFSPLMAGSCGFHAESPPIGGGCYCQSGYSPLAGGSPNYCVINNCRGDCGGSTAGTCTLNTKNSESEYASCVCKTGYLSTTNDDFHQAGTCEPTPCPSQNPASAGTCTLAFTGGHWKGVTSCNSSYTPSRINPLLCIKNPCDGITCNDGTNSHGTCQVNDNDQAECACADGYKLSFPHCYKDLCSAGGINPCSPGSCSYNVGAKGYSCDCTSGGSQYQRMDANTNTPRCMNGSNTQVWQDCATSAGKPSYRYSGEFSCECPTGMEYSTSESQCISPSSCSSTELILTKGEKNKTRCCPNCSGSNAKTILTSAGDCKCVCSGTDIMIGSTCKANPCAANPTPCGSNGTCTFDTNSGGFTCKCSDNTTNSYTQSHLSNLCNLPNHRAVLACGESDCGTNSTCVQAYGLGKCACSSSSLISPTNDGKNCVCLKGRFNGTSCVLDPVSVVKPCIDSDCGTNSKCSTSSNQCVCSSSFFTSSTSNGKNCVLCPKGTYWTAAKTCHPCPEGAKTCISPLEKPYKLTCKLGYYIKQISERPGLQCTLCPPGNDANNSDSLEDAGIYSCIGPNNARLCSKKKSGQWKYQECPSRYTAECDCTCVRNDQIGGSRGCGS